MKPCVAPLHSYEPGEQSWALFIDPPTSYRFSVATLITIIHVSLKLKVSSSGLQVLHIETQDVSHPAYNKIFKMMAVACILLLSNAVSERGFSTLGNIKTAEKSRMLPW